MNIVTNIVPKIAVIIPSFVRKNINTSKIVELINEAKNKTMTARAAKSQVIRKIFPIVQHIDFKFSTFPPKLP